MEQPDIDVISTVDAVSSPANHLESLQTIQREVQRKFGRNLLLLQQYERLMKGLVAEQDIAGPIGELQQVKENQIKAIANKTLGQVVGDLTGNYITVALPADHAQQTEEPPVEPNQPWVRFSFRMEMTEDNFKETERKLAVLVGLRNDLAHHFLENYDIWTEPGCQVAITYLDECCKQIEVHYEQLRQWAKHTLEARENMAAIARTPAFKDFIVHGIFLGGAGVHWPSCTIVNLLRDADEALTKDGWTSLQDAIDHIRKVEPEHTPTRYGCSSWRQVLHESAQFEVRREQAVQGAPTLTWYRRKST